jgi:hypothetical protein
MPELPTADVVGAEFRDQPRFKPDRPRVVDATERCVVVTGRTADGPDTIVFANRRGCPIIG